MSLHAISLRRMPWFLPPRATNARLSLLWRMTSEIIQISPQWFFGDLKKTQGGVSIQYIWPLSTVFVTISLWQHDQVAGLNLQNGFWLSFRKNSGGMSLVWFRGQWNLTVLVCPLHAQSLLLLFSTRRIFARYKQFFITLAPVIWTIIWLFIWTGFNKLLENFSENIGSPW